MDGPGSSSHLLCLHCSVTLKMVLATSLCGVVGGAVGWVGGRCTGNRAQFVRVEPTQGCALNGGSAKLRMLRVLEEAGNKCRCEVCMCEM